MEFSKNFLEAVRMTPKQINEKNPIAQTQRSSRQWNLDVEFVEEPPVDEEILNVSMKVLVRQSMLDKENFSCGIQLIKDNRKTILSRYNGASHTNDVAHYECHIHNATAESINRGDRKPEHVDTQVTDRYTNMQGAFKCMCEDYNIAMENPDLLGDYLV